MSKREFPFVRAAILNPGLFAMVTELNRVLKDCKTILDLGCGHSSPAKFLRGKSLVGMDGYEPDLRRAQERGTHDEYILGDVRTAAAHVAGRRFDACIALDVIEHLPKEDGWKMMESMERLATRCVVLFTPNGFIPQFSENGDLQQHLSGWDVGEMQQAGYKVIGMLGPKCLRGEKAIIKFRPRSVWTIVSLLGHYTYSRRHPRKAFSIFCTKRLSPQASACVTQ
ncbi:MAG: class I SAM-dependent methyltransferase [Verrucomicrobiae bacterium]|nr:class I SAM-dependent methyltransferase [Verrucomicrobiae bacterium]